MFKGKSEQKELAELTNSSTIIGKGSTMEGTIETFGNIRIEGKIIGNIRTKSKLAIGDSAQIEGKILAQNAEIAGEVKGIVEVSDLLVLKSTAIIHGDIVTNKIQVDAGATINGTFKMGAMIKEIQLGERTEKSPLTKEKTA